MKKKLTFPDNFYQWLANKIFSKRLIWFCVIRAWGLYQGITNNNKLPSQVLVVELLKRLDANLEN
jgi:hypothetical protein